MKKKAVLSLRAFIVNELGMHARPATKIAEMAMAAQGEIWLNRDAEQVDATSVIDILTLGCSKGSCIEIQAENREDEGILQGIQAFFEHGFGEL